MLPPIRAGDLTRLRGHQAGIGAGLLQLLHRRRNLRVHPRRRPPGRSRRMAPTPPIHLWSSILSLAAPIRTRRPTTRPPRRHLHRQGVSYPQHRQTAAPSAMQEYLARAEEIMRREPATSAPPASTSARTSNTCGGSRYLMRCRPDPMGQVGCAVETVADALVDPEGPPPAQPGGGVTQEVTPGSRPITSGDLWGRTRILP